MALAQAQGLLQQGFRLGGVHGIQVHPSLTMQRPHHTGPIALLPPQGLRLPIPSQSLVEAAAQTGQLAQVEQEHGVSEQDFRRQGVQIGRQGVQTTLGQKALTMGLQQTGGFFKTARL